MDELIEHHVLYQPAHLHVEIRSCVQIVEISRINNKLKLIVEISRINNKLKLIVEISGINNKLKFLFSLVAKTLFSLNKNTIFSIAIISLKLDIPRGGET